jgi:hypothetical protein
LADVRTLSKLDFWILKFSSRYLIPSVLSLVNRLSFVVLAFFLEGILAQEALSRFSDLGRRELNFILLFVVNDLRIRFYHRLMASLKIKRYLQAMISPRAFGSSES